MSDSFQLSFDMGPLKAAELPFQKKGSASRNKKKEEQGEVKKKSSSKNKLPLTKNAQEVSQPTILSVSDVTRRVASLLEKEIGDVWIEGEISNYRCQSSGHHYFTLKDAESQIACVLFARSAHAALLGLTLRDGIAVQIFGSVTVYQPRGQYQLMVRLVQAKGQGLLQAKFEALKQRLAGEGLFDADRKRPVPRFPQRIGVVTSSTGAALADFLHVLHRRHPGLQVVINPVRVQGEGAAKEIAAAIAEFSQGDEKIGPIDVIVVTRGGGSLEDLWPFNEEVVARAIAASHLPIVSAVGHEIDVTISDFVADLRAPTPSAAAELLAADSIALREKLFSLVLQLGKAVATQRNILLQRIVHLERSSLFRAPEQIFSWMQQSLDHLQESLFFHVQQGYQKMASSLSASAMALRLHHPRQRIAQARQQEMTLSAQFRRHVKYRQELLRSTVERLRSSLVVLNPEATLARGFTITRNGAGEVVTSIKKVAKGGLLRTQFADGIVDSIEKSDILEIKRPEQKKPWE